MALTRCQYERCAVCSALDCKEVCKGFKANSVTHALAHVPSSFLRINPCEMRNHNLASHPILKVLELLEETLTYLGQALNNRSLSFDQTTSPSSFQHGRLKLSLFCITFIPTKFLILLKLLLTTILLLLADITTILLLFSLILLLHYHFC